MKNFLSCLLLLTSVFLTTSCSKEDEEGSVKLQVEVLEEGGVVFTAQHDLGNVKETGFFYSESPRPGVNNGIKVTAANASQFSAPVNEGLHYNSEYFVRAYVLLGSLYIYSDTQSFVSFGSKAPIITYIPTGQPERPVTISGKHLKGEKHETKVYFDDLVASISGKTDSTIIVRVPADLKRYNPVVTVHINEKKDVYKDFTFHIPVITGVSNLDVSLGDTIMVYGKHLNYDYTKVVAYEGETRLNIVANFRDSIQIAMPLEAESSFLELKIHSLLQVASFKGIKVKKPIVTYFPRNIKAFDTLSFRGKGLSPVPSANRVYFGPHLSEVLSASAEKVTIRVPLGPYEDHYPEVRYELMDYNLNPGEVRIADKFLLKNVGPAASTTIVHHFVADDIGYLVEKDNGSNISFLAFDPATDTHSKFNVKVPSPKHRGSYLTPVYNKSTGRVFFHFASETDNFYEYYPATRRFTKLPDVPGKLSIGPALFSIGNKIYKTLGRDPDSYNYGEEDSLSHTYSFDLTTHKWARQQDFPRIGERWNIPAFVMGETAFIGNSTHTTIDDDYFTYHGPTDSWQQVAKFPWSTDGTAFFTHKGQGYLYNGYMQGDLEISSFRYDPSAKTWTPSEAVNDEFFTYFNHPQNAQGLQFSNKVYVVLQNYSQRYFFEADLESF